MNLTNAAARRGSGAGSVAVALAAGAVLLATLVPAARARELTPVGTLPISTQDTVVADETTRRLIVVRGDNTGPLRVSVFDGDSLQPERELSFSQWWNQGATRVQPTAYALDEAADMLYMVGHHTIAEKLSGANPVLVRINLRTFETGESLLAPSVPPGFVVQGMLLRGNRLYLLQQAVITQPPQRIPGTVMIADVDPATGQARGVIPIRGCQEVISTARQAAFLIDGDAFLIACSTASLQGLAAAPGVPAILSVPLSDPTSTTPFFLPGGFSLGDTLFDETARRMLVVGSTPGHPNQSVWIFDVGRRVYLGQVAAGDQALFSAGVNPSTGRLYLGTQNSILISSDRGLQIPQAFEFPGIATAAGSITPIPFNQYVIVPVGTDAGTRMRVYRDSLPAEAIAPGEPVNFRAYDRIAAPTPQFSADVQAFGWRLHQIGGLTGVQRNGSPPLVHPFWDSALDRLADVTGVRDGTADVVFARLQSAHLSEADAAVKGFSVDADDNTDSNMNILSGQAVSTPGVSCVDFGGGEAAKDEHGVVVECRKDRGVVAAEAEYAGFTLPGIPLSVGRAGAATKLLRNPGGGLVATAHAEAHDLEIGGTVEIGFVASDVEVRSSGRPNSTRATYSRSFRNVRAGDFSCTSECDVWNVLAALSGALDGQFVVEFPLADEVETPGGAHAHAVRDPWEHQQDIVLNAEGDQELQIPALRILFVNDNASASRTLLDFAATKADASWFKLAPETAVEGVQTERPVIVPPVPPSTVVTPGTPPPVDKGTGGAVTRFVKVLGHGWKFLFTGGPGVVIRSVALWALFVAPLFFAVRRRHLMRLAARSGL